MPPVLLFGETFDGEVGTINLSARAPVPGPGAAAEYVGAATRYKVFAGGYAAGQADTGSVARWPYLVPVPLAFRIVADVYREGADMVGGEMEFYAFAPDTAIGTWDFTNCIRCAIQRHSYGGVSASMTWVKAVGDPAPPVVQLAFAGDLLHEANTGRRYGFEFDPFLGRVRVWRANLASYDAVGFGTGWVMQSEGTLPPELIAHLTADRHIGWQGHHATQGLTGFDLVQLQVYDMGAPETPATGAPCTLLLRVYDDDRVTVLWEAASDPDHPFPYLEEPEGYGEQQLDIAGGSASIATVTVRVIDKAQIADDQDSGFVTDKLAEFGIPAIGGHRCEFIRFDPDGDPVVIIDGPAGLPAMGSYSGFEWEIRDWREIERKVRCFDVVGPTAPIELGAADTTPTVTGTDPGFTWGTEYH